MNGYVAFQNKSFFPMKECIWSVVDLVSLDEIFHVLDVLGISLGGL